MLLDDVDTLTYFSRDEQDWRGNPIQWGDYDAENMEMINHIRGSLAQPILLIRGGPAHGPDKETCIDWVCPKASYEDVVMTCLRFPFGGLGLYEGGSVHTDCRETVSIGRAPARWLAFKARSSRQLQTLDFVLPDLKDGWFYMPWKWELLRFLLRLNSRIQGEG